MSTAETNTISPGFTYKHGDRPLDGYTIQRAAGRGGFGEVYYAVSDSGREVALKLVQAYVQIELRGIAHCMNLKSPHLVTVFDVKYGTDGRPWVIMEYVSGPSLRELLDNAPSGLGVQKSAFFLREIAKGLTYLHECGIVHRDLKPGNIFYENGYVKIGDYGLSKAMSTSQYSGQTVTVGTVHYMAPEIGEGRYDKSIDIYALGTLLFEMLTGQVPFFGASTTEVLMKHLSAQVDTTNIEEPFATVIKKALAKNPAERYQSVQEMVEGVFGSEHVRNSVSSFSPESLTMVAGQVARKLPGNSSFSNSSGAANPNAGNAWDRFGQNIGNAVNRFNDAIGNHVQQAVTGGFDHATNKIEAKRLRMQQRLAAKRQRLERRWAKWQDGPPPWGQFQQQQQYQNGQYQQQSQSQMMPTAGVADDPVSLGQRRALAAITIALVAIGTGVANHHEAPAAAVFTALAVLGGTLGILFGRRRLLPGLPSEPWILKRLAIGGCAAAFAAAFSLPAAPGFSSSQGGIWLAMLVCMFVPNWIRLVAPDRRDRVRFWPVIWGILIGGFIGDAIGDQGALVAGIIGGTALVVQIAAPWSAGGSWETQQRGTPAGFPIGPANPPAPPMPSYEAPMVQPQAGPPPIVPADAANPAGAVAPASPVAAQAAPPMTPRRIVSRGARVVWLSFFVALATLGFFLLCVAGAVNHNDDELAAMVGFGLLSILAAAVCLQRNFVRTYVSLWRYVVRPWLQIFCAGSVIVSLCMMSIGNMSRNDVPVAMFFIIFPSIVFLVITFFIPRGEPMPQAILSAAPPAGYVREEGFFLGRLIAGAGRLIFTVVGLAILLAAFLLAIAVAVDLPGLFNSHLVNPDIPAEMRRSFGNADWPRLLRTLGGIVSFLLAVIAAAILMQTRKRYGMLHMLRVVGAAFLLFVSIQVLAHSMPGWSQLVRMDNGWEMLDQYLQHIRHPGLIGAAVPAGLAIILLLIPGERKQTLRFAAVKEEVVR